MKGQRGFIDTLQLPAAPRVSGHWWRALRLQLRRWTELARQRRQLAMLSDYQLKDIGLSRADIMEESDRPFWDDPLKP
ncbi:DUF1127 domain-containing protein [Pseudomonas sp. UL073]|uniref:DUF1127 domain-containing protein n=1 Tax=Zestomonas insulae TaxID=2809017 RepID=A0ABS2I7W8_9GAMM|nr:DUF1127 domain-containing protein [Pseudomonas insulae]MBM7059239.1 DUF1127 domain-containing protein [Pseudomonas insulae]